MLRRRACRAVRTKTSRAAPASAADPFGPDGFGDAWDKDETFFDSDNDEKPPHWQEEFSGVEFDWPKIATTRQAKEEAKREKEAEQHQRYLAAQAERIKQKEAIEAAEAAAALAKAKSVAAAKDAKERWDHEVENAKNALALAQPLETLRILFSIVEDESFVNTIDMEERGNIAQMYVALHNHYQLQKIIAIYTDTDESSKGESTRSGDGRSEDESTGTIGGDTVQVNRSSLEGGSLEDSSESETRNATAVVDRLPF